MMLTMRTTVTLDADVAALVHAAMTGPWRAKARRMTVPFISRPDTGGRSSEWAAGGSAPRARRVLKASGRLLFVEHGRPPVSNEAAANLAAQ